MSQAAAERAHESLAPDGTRYPIPSAAERTAEYAEIRARAEAHRAAGGKVVAVQGLGFVGSAVAAVIAATRTANGAPAYFVVGTDLATPSSYWKIARIRAGEVPIPSPDDELSRMIAEAAIERRNLAATAAEEAYALADVIVVDVPLDVVERFTETVADIDVRLGPFESAIDAVGRFMRSEALVLVETTVPIGICERVVLPRLREARARRGITEPVLLAHAYERVMPGPRYVDSIARFWRTFSGIDERSSAAARGFLASFIDVERYPLRELPDTMSSEMAKVLENSYRAVNIAFMYEWTLLAEALGVNLFDVVNSIRVRKGTHDNMRFPGFGVGGYCLTKDSLLAQWSATTLFETGLELSMTLEALRINHRMPLHTLELAEKLADGPLAEHRIAVAGVSYLAEVADTRNSPTEVLADEMLRKNIPFTVSDPYLAWWSERPDVPVRQRLEDAVADATGLILAVPHERYRALRAADLRKAAPKLAFVIDGFDVLDDATAQELHHAGVRVAGVGKGHWTKRGYGA